jgi:hypothetical protein
VPHLKKGDAVPADGRVYRDHTGQLVFGMRYLPTLKPRHDWLQKRIEDFESRRFM